MHLQNELNVKNIDFSDDQILTEDPVHMAKVFFAIDVFGRGQVCH